MKSASEFRAIARDALRGNWKTAVLVGLVAGILGGASSGGPEFSLDITEEGAHLDFEYANQTLYSFGEGLDSGVGAFLTAGATYIVAAAIVIAIGWFCLGSIISTGYAKFNLQLIEKRPASFDSLFAYFDYWRTMIAASFLQTLYILLWMLLFILPGIAAAYSYAMTPYILAENPNLTASEAIRRSKEMMDGNRMDLFILELTFIGWELLCILTLGIGNLWLGPYKAAARAAFYKELTGPQKVHEPMDGVWEDVQV